jgi:hypothetical protein
MVLEPSITMHNWTLTEDAATHGGTSIPANAKTNASRQSERTALDSEEAFPLILVTHFALAIGFTKLIKPYDETLDHAWTSRLSR